jgi:poly-gamma-glutamate capsule biosynthesis protein CapA/YwtB (metallophosphatase superfamily)
MKELISINIGGDLVISNDKFKEEDLDVNLVGLFAKSDLNILNLECPVTTVGTENKIIKTGPHIKGSQKSLTVALKQLNVNLVTLANNHIMDYGRLGLQDTFEFCKSENVDTVGAGYDVEEASKVYRTEVKGHKISVINFAENEWCNADEDTAGANPMDIISNVNQIKKEKTISDTVIVIIHGGHEYHNMPSPRMVKQYRFYAENGASIIVGHHTHCITGYEIHNNIPIFYGLGNFLFEYDSIFESWYTGLVLHLEIDTNNNISFKLIPVEQNRSQFQLKQLSAEDQKTVFNKIENYNSIISDSNLLNVSWKNYLETKRKTYLQYLSPLTAFKNHYIKGIISKLNLYKLFLNTNRLKVLLNIMRCEAHSEITQATIKRHLRS